MRLKVTLGIGYPTASHTDEIDVDDDEYAECETDQQREALCSRYWQDWANNYIDGGFEIIKG